MTEAQLQVRLEESWRSRLADEFGQPYMQQLRAFLRAEKNAGRVVYPHSSEWFKALDVTPFEAVRVVILGQDPYHGPRQAHGLCFSVQPGTRWPPSLENIFREVADDCGVPGHRFPHGCLEGWAQQGVLLLNSVLTVRQGEAGSHQGQGWEQFTDRVVALLSEQREHLVFLLWGSYAQKKGQVIDETRHRVLKSVHPSPLSAQRGFFGNHHFSLANDYLAANGVEPIDWLAL